MRALLGERPRGLRPKINAALLADMEAMGAPPEQLDRLRPKAEPENQARVVEVEPELWDAFRVFRLIEPSQWRKETVLAGKTLITLRHSLDYGVIPGLAQSIGIQLGEQTWEQIGAMQDVARVIYADRQRMELARRR